MADPSPTEWFATGASIASAVVAVVAVIASGVTAFWTVRESNRARDLATIESVRRAAQETSIALFEKIANGVDDEIYGFYARHYLDVLEFAALILEKEMIGMQARQFLFDWLKVEAKSIERGRALKKVISADLDSVTYKEFLDFCRKVHVDLVPAPEIPVLSQ